MLNAEKRRSKILLVILFATIWLVPFTGNIFVRMLLTVEIALLFGNACLIFASLIKKML